MEKDHDDSSLINTIESYEKTFEGHKKRLLDDFDMKRLEKETSIFLSMLKGKKILDAGCGPGRDASFFLGKDLDVTGIDLAPSFIEHAKAYAPKGEFIIMDMRKMTFPDKSFDGVWADASIIHLTKDEAKRALYEMRRVLKDEGIFFVNVKEGKGENICNKDYYNNNPKFVSFYDEDKLKNIVSSCGFTVREFSRVYSEYTDTMWLEAFATKA